MRLHVAKTLAVWVGCSSLICTGAARNEWSNSLKPVGQTAGEVVLVKDGRPVCSIRIPINATPIEKSAAKELQHWIEEITVTRPEITTSDVHPSVRLQTDPALGEEGIRIAVEKDDVVLTGGTGRGVVNAVYALLEEDLGCRFYTIDSIKLPKGTSLSVRPVSRTYIPKLRLRDPYYKCAFDPTWSLQNRTNSPSAVVGQEYGGHIDYGGLFVHTHAALLPADKYFAAHPDYFALSADGKRYAAQLCPTHPDVAKLVTAAVIEALKAHPTANIVSVSKNDSGGDQLCYCERCRKIREREGSEIGCQLVLVNAVAEAVEKNSPHVAVDTLAYLDTLQPPKHMRPRANVVIRLCNDTKSAFMPARQIAFGRTIVNWARVHDRFSIWDYDTNFQHYLAPVPNIDVMADNIRFWVSNHVEGIMLQGCYQGPGDGDEMKAWVTSKLLWDPTRDEKALVQDFIWGHYGAAAPAMAEYEDLRNGLRRTFAKEMAAPPGAINFPMDVPFLNKNFIDKATTILNRAKQLAAGDERLLPRIERAELPILYVKCSRGPKFTGPTYANDVAEFERIGKQVGLKVLSEGQPNFDSVVAKWKQRIAKTQSNP
jgi:hypothetical protein